jgi:hypothetical protein
MAGTLVHRLKVLLKSRGDSSLDELAAEIGISKEQILAFLANNWAHIMTEEQYEHTRHVSARPLDTCVLPPRLMPVAAPVPPSTPE